jgi:hypothetical protein
MGMEMSLTLTCVSSCQFLSKPHGNPLSRLVSPNYRAPTAQANPARSGC